MHLLFWHGAHGMQCNLCFVFLLTFAREASGENKLWKTLEAMQWCTWFWTLTDSLVHKSTPEWIHLFQALLVWLHLVWFISCRLSSIVVHGSWKQHPDSFFWFSIPCQGVGSVQCMSIVVWDGHQSKNEGHHRCRCDGPKDPTEIAPILQLGEEIRAWVPIANAVQIWQASVSGESHEEAKETNKKQWREWNAHLEKWLLYSC